jgi:hypothetical protein
MAERCQLRNRYATDKRPPVRHPGSGPGCARPVRAWGSRLDSSAGFIGGLLFNLLAWLLIVILPRRTARAVGLPPDPGRLPLVWPLPPVDAPRSVQALRRGGQLIFFPEGARPRRHQRWINPVKGGIASKQTVKGKAARGGRRRLGNRPMPANTKQPRSSRRPT